MIRAMVADGIYYENDPDILRSQIQEALRRSAAVRGSARVVVAPFGAYSLSLPYIAQALKSTGADTPECVVVLAPPTSAMPAAVMLPESETFATPFGELSVSQAAMETLLAEYDTIFAVDEIAHLQEHSIEIMLPAVHYLFGEVPILPLLVGEISTDQTILAREGITRVLAGKRFLVIAAANLSGFVPPHEADARARKLVRLMMTSPGDEIVRSVETYEDPPRSLNTLVLAHLLAGADTRPDVISRGTFETEYEGDVGTVVFASIAYHRL